MASFVVSTPSPPARVHTPGTPKHGYSDPWEPFSPRKSARLSSRRANNNRTPSPGAPSPSSSHRATRMSQKSSDSFSTPVASPRKKRVPAMDSVRRASGTLTAEGTATAADILGIGSNPQQKPTNTGPSSSAPRATGMLPTPAKTPRKQPDGTTDANVLSVARNLFASETNIMPSPKKKRSKKYSGLTLESFTAEDIEEPIQIFTDSRDRIPEKDTNAENPFYGAAARDAPKPKPTQRRSSRRLVSIPGEGRETIEEAVRREDGTLSMFRGKMVFRKFPDSTDANSVGQPETDVDEETAGTPERRRITRSSIKPRLLFPPAGKDREVGDTVNEDEEAATDIEDPASNDADAADTDIPATPLGLVDEQADTPKAPRFAPASPPSTSRTTRFGSKLEADATPMKKPTKARSPFDGWRRSKRTAETHGQKRAADPLDGSDEASKRQRA
ncbi:hypothetical protein DL768_004086 [Monosporascus sp. mg162]|nr:hypothetical protein DL768_004086 [Monosporascus sp. mg162]